MFAPAEERRVTRSNRPRAALTHFLQHCGGAAILADERGQQLANSSDPQHRSLGSVLQQQRFAVGGRAFLLSVLKPLRRNLGETTLGCARILATTSPSA